jgi:hypothetical protein
MAIDKESSGFPEVDFERPTTKVNLAIIVAGAAFYAITFGIVIYFMKNAEPDRNVPSPPPAQTAAP